MSFRKTAATGLIAATLTVATIVASTPAMAHGHGGGGHGGGGHGGFHGSFAGHNHGFGWREGHSFAGYHHRGFHPGFGRFRDNGWDTCYPGWWLGRYVDTFQNACY
ncbi:hypothetical protein [Rhizobium sp. Root1220]|uniref:hypothetical protein n=1 Tax=Rhizobium sp. Root1220 TaxID=1736432 RepID=UPI0009E85379|nr:hypothetical protein [Rhizobium sp. Root1220]